MIIKFDRSYISAGTRELIERGYAREELDKLVFRFEYTEEERIQNREMAVKLSSEVWAASADRAARRRSEMMEPVMKSIAGEFVCYQYDHEEKLALRKVGSVFSLQCAQRIECFGRRPGLLLFYALI